MSNYKTTTNCHEIIKQLSRSILILLVGLFVLLNSPVFAQETDETVAEQPAEAEASASADSSDGWNWDSFEVDDTPLDPNESVQQATQTVASRRLTIEEVTSPDLDQTPLKVYELFKGIPDFEVIPSTKDTEMHPCSNCHQFVKSNLTPRKLDIPHDNFELQHGLHGKGQFWCFTCHDEKGSVSLKTLDGELLNFEDAYILCSQCHVTQARDWAFGAHGKRLGNWQGKRQVYNCTACHYQHAPAFKTREALAGPEIRMGLQRPPHWTSSEPGETTSNTHGVFTWSNRHE